jgi:hypothetical protein
MKDSFKHDDQKIPYHLLPMDVIDDIVEVQKYGLKKYGRANSWKNIPDGKKRFIAAALRHISKFQQGERLDESGLHHLSHALCSLVYALWIEKRYLKKHGMKGGKHETNG